MAVDFRSDNIGKVDHQFIDVLSECNIGSSDAYGGDKWSKELNVFLEGIAGQSLKFFPCFTGSAANMLALSLLTPRHGSVACPFDSHIIRDETSGPEFFTGGKIVSSGCRYKITLENLIETVETNKRDFPFSQPITTFSIAQTNEWGLVYTLDELEEISLFCKEEEIKLHIDGARLHNALVTLQISFDNFVKRINPSTISLGSSKNGGMFGDILLVFEKELWSKTHYLHRKFGQDIAKSRYISAQMLHYFRDNYWLDQGKKSNVAALELSDSFSCSNKIKQILPVDANMLFVNMGDETANYLRRNNLLFSSWPLITDCYRFVCNPFTSKTELERVKQVLLNLN